MTIDQPSQVFRSGCSEDNQYLSLSPNQPIAVTIGLSSETNESIRNIVANPTSCNVNARRPLVAQKLHKFCISLCKVLVRVVAG